MKVATSSTIPIIKKNKKNSSTIPIPLPDEVVRNTGQSRSVAFFPNRISLEKLRAIWNDDESHYTDDQLLQIRDWFYTVAELSLSNIACQSNTPIQEHIPNPVTHTKTTLIIPLQNNQVSDEATEESHSIHPRIHRRAS